MNNILQEKSYMKSRCMTVMQSFALLYYQGVCYSQYLKNHSIGIIDSNTQSQLSIKYNLNIVNLNIKYEGLKLGIPTDVIGIVYLLKATVPQNSLSFLYFTAKSFETGILSFILYFYNRHQTQGYLWGLPSPRCQALEHSSDNIWPFGELHRQLCTQLGTASGDVTESKSLLIFDLGAVYGSICFSAHF